MCRASPTLLVFVEFGGLALLGYDGCGNQGFELTTQVGIGGLFAALGWASCTGSPQPALRRRARTFKLPIIASGATNRNMLMAAAPGRVSSLRKLHALPVSGSGVGSCAAISVGPGRSMGSTGAGAELVAKVGVFVGTAVGAGVGTGADAGVGTAVGAGVGTRVGVEVGPTVGVGGGVAVTVGAGVGDGGGVGRPSMVSVKLPVCPARLVVASTV